MKRHEAMRRIQSQTQKFLKVYRNKDEEESARTPVIEIVDDKEEKSDEEVIIPSDNSIDSEAEVEFDNADPEEEDKDDRVNEKPEVVSRDVTETEEESPSNTQSTDKDVSTKPEEEATEPIEVKELPARAPRRPRQRKPRFRTAGGGSIVDDESNTTTNNLNAPSTSSNADDTVLKNRNPSPRPQTQPIQKHVIMETQQQIESRRNQYATKTPVVAQPSNPIQLQQSRTNQTAIAPPRLTQPVKQPLPRQSYNNISMGPSALSNAPPNTGQKKQESVHNSIKLLVQNNYKQRMAKQPQQQPAAATPPQRMTSNAAGNAN